MKKTLFLVISISLLLGYSCNNKSKNNSNYAEEYFPPAPSMLLNPDDEIAYIATHYWDNYNFADSAKYTETPEQIFLPFLLSLYYVDLSTARISIANMMQKAEVDSLGFLRFANIAEKYLYDANSPYRSDELHIPVLQSIIATKWIDNEHKAITEYRLNMALKNRIGETAIDLNYTTESGKTNSLHKITGKYTLIFFNNPGCTACSYYIEQLQNIEIITRLVEQKQLVILAFYPDEDLSEWHNYKHKIPANWINAYDKTTEVQNKELYDLRAIPTLYLLDKDKKIILKDTQIELVEQFLLAAE